MKKLIPYGVPLLPRTARFAIACAVFLAGCEKNNGEQTEREMPRTPALREQTADLRALIDDELAAGNKRVVIPPGRYRVKAQRGNHLVFKNLSDVEIIADNVEMVCTSTVRGLYFENCSNVTLRGLTVDYDPLPFTQGRIVSMTPDKSSMVFEVADGYPEYELEERIQIYDPATAGLRRGDARWDERIESLGGHRYRVRKSERYRFNPARDTERVGDILVTNNHSGSRGSPHTVELRSCKGIRLEDITLFASPCFGFLEYDCDGTGYTRCVVDRRPPADDPVKRALPRMRSLNADAFHSKDAAKGPAIIGCKAHYQGDDCVNINGRYHYVRSVRGKTMRIAVWDGLKFGVGEPVEFLPHTGPRPPDAKVVAIRRDSGPITGAEKALIGKVGLDERLRSRLLSGKLDLYNVTLDREVDLPDGSAVCCPLRVGSGFAVKDCDFGHNRSRGILIKASRGEVTGNRIINSMMAAVLVSPEYWWMEGGISSDVVVRDNLIEGCLQTPIQILARGADRKNLPLGARRNISIVNNRISECPWPLIHVTSTSNLVIENNVLPEAPAGGVTDRDGQPSNPVLLENCDLLKPVR